MLPEVFHVTNSLGLFRVCLGFVWGLRKVYFGVHLGFSRF